MKTTTTGHSGYTFPQAYNYAVMQKAVRKALAELGAGPWFWAGVANALGLCSQTIKNWYYGQHIPGVRQTTGENIDNLFRLYEQTTNKKPQTC